MKKNIIPLISLALLLCGCSHQKPIISLADLMINKIAQSPSKDGTLDKVLKLREYDRIFYKALYHEENEPQTLSKQYFYARIGSCCPCSPGGMSCCSCSSGSAFGIPSEAEAVAAIDSGGSVFMLTKTSASPQDSVKLLTLDKETIDGIDIFTVPEDKRGKYEVRVSFKRDLMDLIFFVEINDKGEIKISDIR